MTRMMAAELVVKGDQIPNEDKTAVAIVESVNYDWDRKLNIFKLSDGRVLKVEDGHGVEIAS
jgi:hypothetical protein